MPEHSSTGSPFAARHERLGQMLQRHGLEALAVNPGPGLHFLTGVPFHLMERPVVALFVPDATPIIVMPEFEKVKLDSLSFEARVFSYTEDLNTWPNAFEKAAKALGRPDAMIGVEPRALRFLELEFLRSAFPRATFVSAETGLAELRAKKDDAEIAMMSRAVDYAQTAFKETLGFIKDGVTERDLAAELTVQLLRAGSESEMPFAPIVAFGPNSANPHASPTDRRLAKGDLIVIDWGGNHNGYFSDLTRMVAFGDPEAELQKIAEITEEANAAARSHAAPGVTAGSVDLAARSVIEKAGYGQYFVHRTGHGLGLEAHEDPYIRDDNEQLLEPGMTFTIEPGIYLPGRGGVRIEDDMVITEGGCESLSTLPRNLIVL